MNFKFWTWFQEKTADQYVISYCFYNKELKRHRFGSIIVGKDDYKFGRVMGEKDRLADAVRHWAEHIETEFQIIAISKIP